MGTVIVPGYRSLPEQVEQNTKDIRQMQLNGSPFNLVGQVNTAALLPEASADNLGELWGVGTTTPYNIYVCTLINNAPAWLDLGTFQGPQGDQGDTGAEGVSVSSINNFAKPSVTAGVTINDYLVTYSDGRTSLIKVTVANGAPGAPGTNGTNGTNGTDGRGIQSITSFTQSGSPSDTVTTTMVTVTYTDNSTQSFYVTAKNGREGATGPQGAPGSQITSITTQGSRQIDGYTETEIDVNLSDQTDPITFTVTAKNGENGAGVQKYRHHIYLSTTLGGTNASWCAFDIDTEIENPFTSVTALVSYLGGLPSNKFPYTIANGNAHNSTGNHPILNIIPNAYNAGSTAPGFQLNENASSTAISFSQYQFAAVFQNITDNVETL